MASINQTTNQSQHQTTHDEMILVVKRNLLFAQGSWQGFSNKGIDECLAIIQEKKEFHPRSIMEQDPTYKQIIPYIIFEHNNHYFLMQRQSSSSEQRLKNKYTLGIGGHVRAEDLQQGSSIFDWATREFHEEISYSGTLKIETIGMVNDDSNPVGQVHMGLVILAHGDSEQIKVKSELKSGELLTLGQCNSYYATMESWSQIVMDLLIKK